MRITKGPIYSKVETNGIPIAQKLLSYRDIIFVHVGYGMKEVVKYKYMLSPKGRFLTGLLPRVTEGFERLGRKVEILHDSKFPPEPLYKLNPIPYLRDYQEKLVEAACEHHRGVIVAPTGAGKTLIAMSIINNYPKARIVFVVPTKSLFKQTETKFREFFKGEKIGLIGDGENSPERITIAIINSLSKPKKIKNAMEADIIIVDECHKVSSVVGGYGQILRSPAPIKIGLTATPPKDKRKWFLEGLVGPILGEAKKEDLVAMGHISKPKVIIRHIPTIGGLKKVSYQMAYEKGVVENKLRNKMVVDELMQQTGEGKTCLVIVSRIKHGHLIASMFQRFHKGKRKFKFLYSINKADEREEIRIALDKKEIDFAITTTVWKEGIDIPSLDVIINAAGGKDEIPCLQWIGRGMRATKDKSSFLIVDFFDESSNFLVSHFGNRFARYCKEGWI